MKAKMILIQEIRAMESKPVIRHKLVDLTTTGGYGLLSEMSIAEVTIRPIHLRDLCQYFLARFDYQNSNLSMM